MTSQGSPDLETEFGRYSVLRLSGVVLLATSAFVLQGCTQVASTGLQDKWLGSIEHDSLYETDLGMPVSGRSSDPFQGKVRTFLAGSLQSPLIGELSGMAASRRSPGLYWAINDSGNQPQLFALDQSGRHIVTHRLPVRNRDWEDLTAYQDRGDSWLMVADTGDNLRQYETSTLYFFREPGLQKSLNALPLHHKIDFRFDGGAKNVESVSVSVADRAIYFVGKGAVSAGLYSLPLDASPDSGPLTAEKVGDLGPMTWAPQASWWEKAFASRVLLSATAMDFSADETLAVIANYRHVYLFRRTPQQSWIEALAKQPLIVTSHRLAQSESVAFTLAGDAVIVSSEGQHAPMLLVKSVNSETAGNGRL